VWLARRGRVAAGVQVKVAVAVKVGVGVADGVKV
jgi:hypothetical protein